MLTLDVLVDARVRPGEQGGVEQAIVGLASGLSQLDGPDRYTFLVTGDPAWLAPSIGGPCRIATTRFPGPRQQRVLDVAGRAGGAARDAARLLLEAGPGVLPRPDAVVGRLRPDVIHFMKHRGWRTRTPNVYVPHDLQHVDLPHHFHPVTRAYRSAVYGAMARQATRVVALTEAQRAPLAAHHRLPPRRVAVIGWAAAPPAGRRAPVPVPDLPPRFVLLPARTWPHKRHDLLVAALALLRRDGLDVPAVLTGGTTDRWPDLQAEARRLGVADLLDHRGHVGEGQLATLFAAAAALVFPTEYEGFGLPVVEAMAAGTPVVCSDIPVLVDVAAGAAAHFRSGDAADLARALREVWTDGARREALVASGRRRAAELTWPAVARAYRDLYREVAAEAAGASRVVGR
jgi:glycosyltransferase involved in cell wall biosynthesis